MTNLKSRINQILEHPTPDDPIGRRVQLLLLALILINLFAIVVETVEPVYRVWHDLFRAVEVISVAVFTIEYILRLWSCAADERFRRPILGRVRFALTPLALVDLAAILPFYLPLGGLDLLFLRIVRLSRLMRVLKLGRYSTAIRSIGNVLKAKKEELITLGSAMMILLLLASSLMYMAENGAQPDKFDSIPGTMWWAVMTLTTVGYGDVYPITAAGRFLASVIAVLGIGMFALPTGVLGAAFLEEVQGRAKPGTVCPHCGKVIDGQLS